MFTTTRTEFTQKIFYYYLALNKLMQMRFTYYNANEIYLLHTHREGTVQTLSVEPGAHQPGMKAWICH